MLTSMGLHFKCSVAAGFLSFALAGAALAQITVVTPIPKQSTVEVHADQPFETPLS